MRRYVFRLAILSLAVLGPTVARADDQQIAQQIVQKLQAEKQAGGLKGFSIDLSVEDGTVWLSGRVANSDQQARALDIARRIPGVKQVVNDLDVAAATNSPKAMFAGMSNAVQQAMGRQIRRTEYDAEQTAEEESGAVGSGVQHSGSRLIVRPAQPVGATGNHYASQAQQVTPVYAGSRNQVPLAFAPSQQI